MDRIANLLGAVGIALNDSQLHVITPNGSFTPVEVAAINTIGQGEGLSIAAVKTTIGLTHPGTIRVVDRLSEKGFVERRNGPDGRTLAIHLTASGRAMWKRQRKARASVLESVIEALTPEQREALPGVLAGLLTALTVDEDQAEAICRLCDESSCPQTICPVTNALSS